MHLQIEIVPVKRCWVSMYNADQNLVENFSIPRPRKDRDFSIQFQLFAWNPETLVCELFIEFNEQVSTTIIHDRLAELGARSISIVTFPKDNDKSATSALNRVVTAAKSEGFVEVVRGSCNPTLSKKVEEMQANEKAKKQATEAEFDEKTQATLKRSLGELKGGISHLETKSDEIKSSVETKSDEIKSSFAEMKEEIKIDYKVTINGQAVTIKKHEETITKQQKNIANKDRQIFDLEDKNKKQRHQIAKLNAERDQNAAKLNTERDRNARELREKNQQIAQLNATIESKNQAIFSFSGQTHQITYTEFKAVLEETKEVLAELKECKKRKRDDE